MADPILALTLWPEWAWAITDLGKRVENRSPRFAAQIAKRVGSGWLAIHAGVKRPADLDAVDMMALQAGVVPTTIRDEDIARGAIVALVTIDGVLPPGVRARWKVTDSAALLFASVVTLAEPIPCRGAQGLWTPPPDVQERLRAALGANHG